MTSPDPTTAEARAELTEAECAALVAALYDSRIGEYGYLGRVECEQFVEPLLPAVERILAAKLAPASGLAAAVEALCVHAEAAKQDPVYRLRVENGEYEDEPPRVSVAALRRALLAAHPAPVPDQQAVAAVTEWFMREHFGQDLASMEDGGAYYAHALADYRRHYGKKAESILAVLATGQGPDTGGEG